MAENILNVTDENFETEVLNSNTPTIVDFWAEWCGPCRALAPKIEVLANQYAGKVKVAKMNVDDSPDTPAKFGVRGIPTVVLFKNGKEIARIVGNQPDDKLKEFVDKGLT
ncbi:MAG TPA: thioredoxin [Bdellovibrionota bacterium]|nr:thioredoxin [Bdellovibrionota bacterium]